MKERIDKYDHIKIKDIWSLKEINKRMKSKQQSKIFSIYILFMSSIYFLKFLWINEEKDKLSNKKISRSLEQENSQEALHKNGQ